MRYRQIVALAIVTVFVAIAITGCRDDVQTNWTPGDPIDAERVKIGVIYIDDGSGAWSLAHDQGLTAAMSELGLREDQVMRKFNVPDADAEITEFMISTAIAEGVNVLIATSWGYMYICEELAIEHPNVVFASASGYKRNDSNFTNYFGSIYEARYLAGIVAGLMTETGKIGYVAAQGINNSEVTTGLNAFAMGVESVNSEARVYVSVTHSWFYPEGERKAAQHLIDEGCDIIAQHSDTVEPQLTAGNAGVWGIGYNVDMSVYAPDTVLTSVIWNWNVYYTFLLESIINGSFETTPFHSNMAGGLVDIAPLSRGLTRPDVEVAVSEARARIVNGDIRVFAGEFVTNDGRSELSHMKGRLSPGSTGITEIS